MEFGFTTAAYVVAAVLFIYSLGGLSGQESAKRAVWYGIVGMAVAVAPDVDLVAEAGDAEVVLQEGEWSGWVTVEFEMIPVMKSVRGICRFSLSAALLVLYGGFMLRYLTVELGQLSSWTDYGIQFDPQLLLRLTP